MATVSIFAEWGAVLRRVAVLAAVVLGTTLTAQAQDGEPNVAPAADCGPVQPAELCVDFDATRSVDPAVPLEFRWHMGDSTVLTGAKISHCYVTRANYTVVLDVVNTATGEVRRAEKTFPVNLLDHQVLNFTFGTEAVHVGKPVAFDALNTTIPTCQAPQITWDFRDGFVQQGQHVTHTFRKPGRYQVRMSLRGYGGGQCSFSNCVSQEIVVAP